MRARGSEDKSYGGEGTRAKGTEWERAQVMLGADRQASRGQTGGKDSMCLREKMVRARMHSKQAGDATCEYALVALSSVMWGRSR